MGLGLCWGVGGVRVIGVGVGVGVRACVGGLGLCWGWGCVGVGIDVVVLGL